MPHPSPMLDENLLKRRRRLAQERQAPAWLSLFCAASRLAEGGEARTPCDAREVGVAGARARGERWSQRLSMPILARADTHRPGDRTGPRLRDRGRARGGTARDGAARGGALAGEDARGRRRPGG